MKFWFNLSSAYRTCLLALTGLCCTISISIAADLEVYREVAMPSGFQVVVNELAGPVFATETGQTL